MNALVDDFLAALKHPRLGEIKQLRQLIHKAAPALEENIKWNGPNYVLHGQDRITMRIQPPRSLQLIFHRGAAVQELPPQKLIPEHKGLLEWKTNDRAVVTIKSAAHIRETEAELMEAIGQWLVAAG